MDATVEAAIISAAATLIGIGGTVVVAVTSARNSRMTNKATIDAAHSDAELTLDATREAQYADRYSKALEQVGSGNPDVRIGGIYALEGIALDSPKYHPTVMEVLTAFIRGHCLMPYKNDPRPDQPPRPDAQAALTVVGRRKAEHDIRELDLDNAYLAYAELRNAQLANARLGEASLSHADLSGANLAGAIASWTDLRHAYLNSAILTRTTLTGANLSAANLVSANLTGAYVNAADLTNADLLRANLTEVFLKSANLAGARLTDADLTDADFTEAIWPEGVPIPEGWTRNTEGRLVRVEQI